MQRDSWRDPIRLGLIAVFVAIGLAAAIMGLWWAAISMACLALAQVASVAYERRKTLRRNDQAEP